jgi:outer membrane protein OmpA-like peptidoglycan-associated protein
LFLKVCSAVQCAHQGQVVHRDLKPANILVTAEGIPKLLDFGVARLLSNPSLYAEQSRLCFITPEYASPEQIRGDDVSVAADVYSLGILLYELLNGHHPYKTANHFLHEIPQAVCRSEPEKPGIGSPGSTTVSDSEAKPASFKSMRIWPLRGARPEQRHLADDLDTIILKAIHRVPEGRYSSVEQFSSDIYRCLAGMPVLARKNTLTYRGLKFAYRNKRLIMVIILALTGLLATHFGIRWEMNKEKSQLRANVLHRLNEILEAHDEERGLVVNTSDVIFNPGYVSLNADARERLARIAGIVLANPKLKLDVEGHTDSHGDAVYNLVISQERAQAVKAYLMTQGIPPEMVMAKGLGGMHPIASNNTETGRRRNRRVEIILSGDMIGTRIADATKSPAFTLVDTSAPSIALLSSIQNPTSGANIALNKKVIGSIQCNANEGPEKAVNGGREDKWCSHANPAFLQVDLGGNFSINQFIVRHAGAGGEPPVLNTRDFNIETSTDGHTFVNVVNVTHNTRNVTIHPVPAIMARFVRLNVRIPAQHGDHSSRIYELEVY